MNPTSPTQDTKERIGRVRHWLARWWLRSPQAGPLLDPERVPSVAQAQEQDALTRWTILVVLHAVEQADLQFITTMTHRASPDERQRSLTWLLETGCITEHRRWERRFYQITPIGVALLARIQETVLAEQRGLPGETPDALTLRSRRWWRVVHVVLGVALLAWAVAVMVPLLVQAFTR